MKNISILIFLLSFSLYAKSQFADKKFYLIDSLDKKQLSKEDLSIIDSTLKLFHSTKSDSVKLKLFFKFSSVQDLKTYFKYNRCFYAFSKKIILRKNSKNVSVKLKNKAIANAMYNLSYCFSETNNEDSCIYYAKASIPYFKKINDDASVADSYRTLGTSLYRLGNIQESLRYYHLAQTIFEKLNNTRGLASCYESIGNVYRNMDEFDKAEIEFKKALAVYKKSNDFISQADEWNYLGIVYKWSGDTVKAEKAYSTSLELSVKSMYDYGIATAKLNLGIIYQDRSAFAKAITNYEASLKGFRKIGSTNGISYTLNCLAVAYSSMGQNEKALPFAKESYKLAFELGYPETIMNSCSVLVDICKKLNLYKEALEYRDIYIEMKDSIQGVESQKTTLKAQIGFENDKKLMLIKKKQEEKEIINTQEKSRQRLILIFVAICFLLVAIFSGYLYNRFRIIRKQKSIIEYQKAEVEEKNKEIVDSINYAKRLQDAILPQLKVVKEYLHNSFILYKPKDIVAGDFYFMEIIDKKIVIAAADCTGHGVPGAMVSVVCSNALTRCVKEFKITDPGKILDLTREIVLETFSKSEDVVKDGMDISIVVIDFLKHELQWSGANNPLWIIKKNDSKSLIEIKADKQPIGQSANAKPFNTHVLPLVKGDRFYIFTDGLSDQFGGENGKKFKTSNFKKLLIDVQNIPINEQGVSINLTFENWRSNFEQVDDICIIGVEYE